MAIAARTTETGLRLGAWVATGLLLLAMTFSGVLYVIGPPPVIGEFRHLGYPDYFRTLLGVAKLLGVAALLMPRPRLLREWAYAGFAFDLIAASLSHVLSGDPFAAAAPPLGVLAVLVCSYVLRRAVGTST